MVISEKFAWAHMPKTGGDSTYDMFQVISKHITFKADPKEISEKHETFRYRQNKTGIQFHNSLKYILNIRRLPSYVLSFSNHQLKHHFVPIDREGILNGDIRTTRTGKKDKTLCNDELFKVLKIDFILYTYQRLGIDFWIRAEDLAEDFIKVMSNFIVIPEDDKAIIRQIKANVNHDYNKEISDNFSKEELYKLYGNCPLWSSIEEKVYGNLLIN